MGLRGIGAKPKAANREITTSHPWDAPGLSRSARVIAFIESLPCTSGPFAGTSLRLRPWQRKFIRAVFATDQHGKRHVRTAVLSMGRKGGKTQLAAALALCALSGPEAEQRGECYSCANDRFQAGRIFSEMVAIITAVPWLDERINIKRFQKVLEDTANGSTYAALSADVATKQGLSPSFVVVDELGSASGRELYDAMDSALGGRAEPLLICISTQAARDEAVLSTLIDYGLRVRRGEIKDKTFHLTLYTAPPEADPWSEKTWRMSNPALGDFRSLDDVRRLAKQAQRMPSAEGSFRQFILNQRCDGTAQFLNAALWKACGAQGDTQKNVITLKGRPCFAGLDLGATKDMTALILVFADDDGGFDVVPYCWLPGATLQERQDEDRMPYATWARQGHLLTFEGQRTTDPKAVALKIAELHGQYDIKALAFDRWRVEDIKRELNAIGCGVPLVPWGQGFRDMSICVDVLEKLVEDRKLRHGMHPVLSMAASNAKIEKDAAGNRKLSKAKSTGRIDAVVALAMALGVAARHEQVPDWVPMAEVV